jgi:hypothetical protein
VRSYFESLRVIKSRGNRFGSVDRRDGGRSGSVDRRGGRGGSLDRRQNDYDSIGMEKRRNRFGTLDKRGGRGGSLDRRQDGDDSVDIEKRRNRLVLWTNAVVVLDPWIKDKIGMVRLIKKREEIDLVLWTGEGVVLVLLIRFVL